MTHKALEDYFHAIVKNKPKELTMFNNLKTHFMSLWTQPVAFVEEPPKITDEDYWVFEMVSNAWIDEEGKLQPIKQTLIMENHDSTWMEVLDRILDAMSNHYGYNIKEQVYYSVEYPLNEVDERTGKPFAGYGRCLNDQVLQQLLLAFPEVYETLPFNKPTKDLFA
jgi:hypothetical protein